MTNNNYGIKRATPLYHQISEDLKYKIMSSEWEIGHKLPSEEELCKIYEVSRITIRKSVKDLEIEGFLYRRSGKGTFVADWKKENQDQTMITSFTNDMKLLGKKAISIDVEIDIVEIDKTLNGYLGSPIGSKAIQLKRVRAIDGEGIIAYSINTFPYRDGFSINPEDYYGSFYKYLESFGIYLNDGKEYVEAILPPKDIAKKLNIETSEPVLKRVCFRKNDVFKFGEYNICYYTGDKYKFYIN